MPSTAQTLRSWRSGKSCVAMSRSSLSLILSRSVERYVTTCKEQPTCVDRLSGSQQSVCQSGEPHRSPSQPQRSTHSVPKLSGFPYLDTWWQKAWTAHLPEEAREGSWLHQGASEGLRLDVRAAVLTTRCKLHEWSTESSENQ